MIYTEWALFTGTRQELSETLIQQHPNINPKPVIPLAMRCSGELDQLFMSRSKPLFPFIKVGQSALYIFHFHTVYQAAGTDKNYP